MTDLESVCVTVKMLLMLAINTALQPNKIYYSFLVRQISWRIFKTQECPKFKLIRLNAKLFESENNIVPEAILHANYDPAFINSLGIDTLKPTAPVTRSDIITRLILLFSN